MGSSESFFDNINYWCQQAGLDPSCIASMTSHLVDRDNAIQRLEFMTEAQRNSFTQPRKGVKCEWSINYQRYKMRTEPDITSSDRIAKQPSYALLEIFRDILPTSENDGMENLMLTSTHCRSTHSELPPAEHFYHKSAMYWMPGFPGDMCASSLSLRITSKKSNKNGLNSFPPK